MTETQSDVSENRKVIEEDWRLFGELDRMRNHWDRPGWPFGRRAYYWYLTFQDNPQLEALALACQQAIVSPLFDLVPVDELHMTIDRVGFMDDVTNEAVRAIGDAAERECRSTGPFPCTLGPLAGSPGAVRFSASPWRPIVVVRDALRRATRSVLPMPNRTRAVQATCGIGYSNTEVRPPSFGS
jgi:hypothetical protein